MQTLNGRLYKLSEEDSNRFVPIPLSQDEIKVWKTNESLRPPDYIKSGNIVIPDTSKLEEIISYQDFILNELNDAKTDTKIEDIADSLDIQINYFKNMFAKYQNYPTYNDNSNRYKSQLNLIGMILGGLKQTIEENIKNAYRRLEKEDIANSLKPEAIESLDKQIEDAGEPVLVGYKLSENVKDDINR